MHPTFAQGLELLRESGQINDHPRLFISSFLAWAYAWRGGPTRPAHAKTIWGFLYMSAQIYYGFNNNLGALATLLEANTTYTEQDYKADAAYLLSVILKDNVALMDRVIWRAVTGQFEGKRGQQLSTCAALAHVMSFPAFWGDKHSTPEIVEGIRCALVECTGPED